MKSLSKVQVKIFLALFLFFVLVSVPIWIMAGDKVNHLKQGEGRWHAFSMLLLCLYCCYVLISHFKANRGLIHIICLLWCIMMSIVAVFNGQVLSLFKLILWPLIFEMSYFAILYHPERIEPIRKVFWVIMVWGTILYLTSKGGNMDRVISLLPNAVFTPLLSVPILMVNQNKRYVFFILLIISVLVLVSMKRSSMLIIATSWLAYVLPMLKMRNKVLGFVMAGVILGAGLFFFMKMNDAMGGQIMERIDREETDTGKNRLAIWEVTWAMIQNSTIKGFLVGHGHFGVRNNSILEISAHNDFMEVIYDYGLISFALYLGLWIYVLQRWWYLKKTESSLLFPYTLSLAIFIFMSLVSHLILYISYFNFLVILWGGTEAMIVNRKMSITKNY